MPAAVATCGYSLHQSQVRGAPPAVYLMHSGATQRDGRNNGEMLLMMWYEKSNGLREYCCPPFRLMVTSVFMCSAGVASVLGGAMHSRRVALTMVAATECPPKRQKAPALL
jgi:hypothetical protein